MSSLSRDQLDALWPQGSAWTPANGADLDLLYDGVGDNWETVREETSSLSDIRSALRTPILSDLEKEYGILVDDSLTEQERRQRLYAIQTATDNDGSAPFLEDVLRAAGFDVFVHINDPPVNPAIFLTQIYLAVCGNQSDVCGNSGAMCGGGSNGELIVNGRVFYHPHTYSSMCGNQVSVCGGAEAVCGAMRAVTPVEIEYEIPTDPGYWGLFFFVGGPATRNATTGSLETIENATIDGNRREEIRRLIVKYKPAHSWAGLVATYV